MKSTDKISWILPAECCTEGHMVFVDNLDVALPLLITFYPTDQLAST